MFTAQKSHQCSGTISRGTLTRRRRTTLYSICSNRIRLCRSALTNKDQSAKSNILLICTTTRALHLELSLEMSVDKFLKALDGFVSRRSLPHTLYSHNAVTFQTARRELAEICAILNNPLTSHYFSHRGMTWKFIAPRAAWWGRWWERILGTTKRCIMKVLGKRRVDYEKLKKSSLAFKPPLTHAP